MMANFLRSGRGDEGMSEWMTIELGDIADFSNGINFDKTAYAKGISLIGVCTETFYDLLMEQQEQM